MKKTISDCISVLKTAFGSSNELAGGENYRYYHGIRTMMACKKILTTKELKNRKVDREALFIAALFHDIGKVLYIKKDGTLDGNRSNDEISHEEMGAKMVVKYLASVVSPQTLDKVQTIIRDQHNPDSRIIETEILHDADVLDSIGLINMWRMFTYSGKKARSIEDTLQYYKNTTADTGRKEHLYFSLTERTARVRRKRLGEFFKAFEKEYNYKDL